MHKTTPEERFWARVEKTEGCWNWTGTMMSNAYGYFRVEVNNTKFYLAHRFSYAVFVAPIPANMVVDHRCYNRRCVNPDHLRAVTKSQNAENRSGLDANNTSGYRGVCFDVKRSGWLAYVRKDGRQIMLGRWDRAEDAALVALGARLALQTHNDLDRKTVG